MLGEGADQARPGAERRLARRFRSEFAHQSHGHHAQASGRAAAGKSIFKRRQRAQMRFKVFQREFHALGDVGLHGGRALSRCQHCGPVQIHCAQLGISATEIDEQGGVHGVAL